MWLRSCLRREFSFYNRWYSHSQRLSSAALTLSLVKVARSSTIGSSLCACKLLAVPSDATIEPCTDVSAEDPRATNYSFCWVAWASAKPSRETVEAGWKEAAVCPAVNGRVLIWASDCIYSIYWCALIVSSSCLLNCCSRMDTYSQSRSISA